MGKQAGIRYGFRLKACRNDGCELGHCIGCGVWNSQCANDEKVYLVAENESTDIPIGETH